MKVLIVGGSGGIGSAVARELASRGGYPIIGFCGNQSNACEVLSQCRTGEMARVDLASEAPAEGIDLAGVSDIVFAAGLPSGYQGLLQCPDQELSRLLQVHALGPLRLVRQLMAGTNSLRSVVFILSTAAFLGGRGGPYALSKALGLSVCSLLASELAPRGIWVAAVAPGWVSTPMARKAAGFAGETLEAIAARHLDGRILDPCEIATLVVDALSMPLAGAEPALFVWDRRVSRDSVRLDLRGPHHYVPDAGAEPWA